MTSSDHTSRIRRVTGAVSAEVDGQTVLVSPKDLRYFGLNGTSSAIWAAIPGPDTGGATTEDVVAAATQQFRVAPDRARTEVEVFVDALVDAGLAEMISGPA